MKADEKKLIEFIQDSGLVTKTDISKAKKKTKKGQKDIGKILVADGKITENELRRISAHILGIPFVSLMKSKIDFDVLSIIPEPIARNHNIIAFKKTDKELEVAMLDVDDLSGTLLFLLSDQSKFINGQNIIVDDGFVL